MAIIQTQSSAPRPRAADAANEDLAPNDHFKIQDGVPFAGAHLLLDMWGAGHLDDSEILGQAMRAAVRAAEATLLHLHLHQFSPQGGVSGVAVLAESHISVHTWPEHGFAAFDIFMCGAAHPHLAAKALRDTLHPSRIELNELRRGLLPGAAPGNDPG